MGKKYLLDTNAVIDFCSRQLPKDGHNLVSEIIDDYPYISVINKIELLSRADVPKAIKAFLAATTVIPLDDSIVEQTISLRKKYKIKLPDAIIAATAVINRQILITQNIKDFRNIKGLQLINPHD